MLPTFVPPIWSKGSSVNCVMKEVEFFKKQMELDFLNFQYKCGWICTKKIFLAYLSFGKKGVPNKERGVCVWSLETDFLLTGQLKVTKKNSSYKCFLLEEKCSTVLCVVEQNSEHAVRFRQTTSITLYGILTCMTL